MILKSFLSPAFLADIQQLKNQKRGGDGGTSMDLPHGWTWKKLAPRCYGVYFNEQHRGMCSRQERIADYVHRLTQCDVNDVTLRKTTDGKYEMFIKGEFIFKGTSPKHCWAYLAKIPENKRGRI